VISIFCLRSYNCISFCASPKRSRLAKPLSCLYYYISCSR